MVAWSGHSLALLALAFLVFLCLCPVVAYAAIRGAEHALTFRTRRWSRLSPDALREKITAYPGRSDEMIDCGPADTDGIFRITYRNKIASIGAVPDADDPEIMPDWPTDEPDENGEVLLEVEANATLGRSDAACHEVVVTLDEGRNVSVSRHDFTPLNGGTLVEYAERDTAVTTGAALGLWLTDHVADFLTSEVDRAEGRATRSHRVAGHNQLVIDIARPFLKFCAAPSSARPEKPPKMRGPWVR